MARYLLDTRETAAVADLADRFLAGCAGWDPLARADDIRAESEHLPVGVRQFLVAARAAERPVFSVAGLPLDEDLVPTPPNWPVAEKEGAAIREELVLLLVASVVGDPFGWRGQQNGRLVHDVCPGRGQEAALTSASSRLPLALHTEDVFHPCRGDYVALLCLRNPDQVGTTVAGLDTGRLPEETRRILHQHRFRFFPDDSHAESPEYGGGPLPDAEARPHEVAPVLFGPPEDPYLRIDADFSRPEPGDGRAGEALRECAQLLAESARRIVLSPGELAFLDNYRVVHGRDRFTPRYDGTDRWLKRTSVARDLRRAYAHTGSRSRVLG